MDIHELRDKSGLHITEDEYAIIHEVYLNQNEIMHVYEMAEFLKANKKDYIKALITRFPGLLADLAVQTEDRKVENAKLRKENASLGCRFEKMSKENMSLVSENNTLQTHIASMQDEIEKLCAELDRTKAILRAYKMAMPLEDLVVKLAEVA